MTNDSDSKAWIKANLSSLDLLKVNPGDVDHSICHAQTKSGMSAKVVVTQFVDDFSEEAIGAVKSVYIDAENK